MFNADSRVASVAASGWTGSSESELLSPKSMRRPAQSQARPNRVYRARRTYRIRPPEGRTAAYPIQKSDSVEPDIESRRRCEEFGLGRGGRPTPPVKYPKSKDD